MLAYSPLLKGAYSRADREFQDQYVGPDTDVRLAALKKVADELGATVNQIVLAWMIQSNPYVIPLVAASTQEQMQEDLGALDIKFSPEQMEYLNKA
jgi:aryl-alcohol dehydrogenase-like predicted oxidoreductase